MADLKFSFREYIRQKLYDNAIGIANELKPSAANISPEEFEKVIEEIDESKDKKEKKKEKSEKGKEKED